MKRHVLILGAGFAGLELATRLSETMADAVRVTLLDRNDSWYFGYSKLEVMLGRQSAAEVQLPYAEIAKDAKQGIRQDVQMATTFPMQRPVPVTGEVSQMFRDGLAVRGIEELLQHLVTSIDPAAREATLANGKTMAYDLFVGIPIHRAPDPLSVSGLAVNGWVPVDQANLRTSFPNVYAIGDVSTGPRTVPKAGMTDGATSDEFPRASGSLWHEREKSRAEDGAVPRRFCHLPRRDP